MDPSDAPPVQVSALPTDFGDSSLLLDVREDDEWRRGHAPGAHHIPMADVPARLAEIDPDKDLYVICRAGGRSQRVALYLQRNGYEATHVDGGLLAWERFGRPVVTDDGTAGVI